MSVRRCQRHDEGADKRSANCIQAVGRRGLVDTSEEILVTCQGSIHFVAVRNDQEVTGRDPQGLDPGTQVGRHVRRGGDHWVRR